MKFPHCDHSTSDSECDTHNLIHQMRVFLKIGIFDPLYQYSQNVFEKWKIFVNV